MVRVVGPYDVDVGFFVEEKDSEETTWSFYGLKGRALLNFGAHHYEETTIIKDTLNEKKVPWYDCKERPYISGEDSTERGVSSYKRKSKIFL